MRETWRLPEQSLSLLPRFSVQHVLVEYDGPQIVTAVLADTDSGEPGSGGLYLGVASDDDEKLVRWILGPITSTEYKALIDGTETLRDALLKPQIFVLDADTEYDWEPRRAWICDGNQLGDDHFPGRGALLPTASRQELAQSLHAVADAPEWCFDGPSVGALGIGFRALSDVLDVFQRLWNAFAQFQSPDGPKASGRPKAEVVERTALRLAGAGTGSLVLQVNPADMGMYQQVAEHFEALVRASADPAALAEELGRLGPRVQGRYNELLASLARHDLQVWARRPGRAAFLSASIASRVLRDWPQDMKSESSQTEAIGHFIGFDMDPGSFTFYDELRDKTYSGPVHAEANRSVTVGPDVRYVVLLDVTMQTAAMERFRQTYTLRSITQIPRAPRPASDTGPFKG